MPLNIQLQNDDKSHCRWIGASELADMEKRSEVDVITRRQSGRITTVARLKPRVESVRSLKEASKPCITYREMLANVGLTDQPNSTLEISRGTILAAQAKIAAFSIGRLVCVPAPQTAAA